MDFGVGGSVLGGGFVVKRYFAVIFLISDTWLLRREWSKCMRKEILLRWKVLVGRRLLSSETAAS